MSTTASSGLISSLGGTGGLIGVIISGVLGIIMVIGICISIYSLCCRNKTPVQPIPQHQTAYYGPQGGYGYPGHYQPPPPPYPVPPGQPQSTPYVQGQR